MERVEQLLRGWPSSGSLFRAALLVALIVPLAGCQRNMADLTAWVEETKRRPGVELAPLPVEKEFDSFIYKAFDARDPFAVPRGEEDSEEPGLAEGTGPRPDPNRPREILEAFPLDSLRMVGTLMSGADFWGLVRDPGGVVHRVKPDEYMGQSHGQITLISEDRIELTETIQTPAGAWQYRQAAIALEGN